MFTKIQNGQCVLIGRRAGWLKREIEDINREYKRETQKALLLDSVQRSNLVSKFEESLLEIQRALADDTNVLTDKIAKYVSFKVDSCNFFSIQESSKLGTSVEDQYRQVEVLKARKSGVENLLEVLKKLV